MWAYVIWDHRRQRLVCSTPNLGFVQQFASSGLPLEGRESAFADIVQVPAAHNLIVTRDGSREAVYWAYTDQSEAYDYSRPVHTFRALLDDAVRLRRRSDVPLAILLSGGLDSSSISALTARQGETDGIQGFTATFPGFKKDERHHAERMAAAVGIKLNLIECTTENVMENLDAATWHMDCPVSRGQILSRWLLLKAASEQARVVFEGQGADEMLAGYPYWHLDPYLRSELEAITLWNAPRRLMRVLDGVKHKIPGFLKRKIQKKRRQPTPTIEIFSQQAKSRPRPSALSTGGDDPGFPDRLKTALHQDHAVRVLPHLLHLGDAISMAHSVESRLPFLDHRVVEFTFGLPFDMLMRGHTTKYVLREAMAADLPAAISQRRDKVGFDTPLDDWLRPVFRDLVRPSLTSRRFRERGLFDPGGIDHYLDQFENGGAGGQVLFRCLAIERWFRLYVDGEGQRFDAGAGGDATASGARK
jgi:asparagine synthase (glutamine-hydrolysing)